MIAVTSVQFEDEEIAVFRAALEGHERALAVPPSLTGRKEDYFPVRAHLRRIRDHREPYDVAALRDLQGTIRALVGLWADQKTPEAWRALGAPGSDEAVAGLAQERVNASLRTGEALSIVVRAFALAEGVPEPGSLRARAEGQI